MIRKVFNLNLIVLLISSVISIVLFELSIRFFLPMYDPTGRMEYYYTDDLVPLAKKNTISRQFTKTGEFDVEIRINKYGLRDNKDLIDSRERDFFVVGDSFSFGHGVDEEKRYSNLLESMLGVNIYNISIPTHITGYEKLIGYAIENGANIKNLIVGICMENDIRDYRSDSFLTYESSNTFFRIKAFLTRSSAFYNAFTSIVHRNDLIRNMAVRLGLVRDNIATQINTEIPYENLRSSADELITISKKFNIANVVIIIIPSRALWIGRNRKNEIEVHDKFVSLIKVRGLQVIDLLPYFNKEKVNPLDYYFVKDGHWNEKGHLIAAHAIYNTLK